MRRVVVGIDGTKSNTAVLEAAASEARYRDRSLQVVTVWPLPAMTPGERWTEGVRRLADETTDRGERQIEIALGPVDDRDVEVELSVLSGSPARGVLEASTDADLLVIGRRDKTRIQKFWLGSVADQCVRHAPCPVMVIPTLDGWAGPSDGHIVVGVDGSDHSLRALRWAMDEAHLRGAAVQVVNCWTENPHALAESSGSLADVGRLEVAAQAQLEAWIEGAGPEVPDTVEPFLRWGDTADVLLDQAQGAAMLVVGSRGRDGFTQLLLGSVSRNVVNQASVPVVIIP